MRPYAGVGQGMSGKSDVHETEWNQPLEGVMLAEPAVAIAALGDVARLVETKAPNGAREFVLFSKSMAEHVDEASKEGGFLGGGGDRVSAAEKSALDEISRVLRV